MRKILLLIVVFFIAKHIAAPTGLAGFLTEEPATGTSTHTETETTHEEESGLELHYSFGTKGFYVCVAISFLLT